jgi:hypothetical protein
MPAVAECPNEFSSPGSAPPYVSAPDGETAYGLVAQRLKWLTVAVFLMALALLFTVAAVLGYIIDFHAGEGILIGGTATGGALMGFAFGWLARRTTE